MPFLVLVPRHESSQYYEQFSLYEQSHCQSARKQFRSRSWIFSSSAATDKAFVGKASNKSRKHSAPTACLLAASSPTRQRDLPHRQNPARLISLEKYRAFLMRQATCKASISSTTTACSPTGAPITRPSFSLTARLCKATPKDLMSAPFPLDRKP